MANAAQNKLDFKKKVEIIRTTLNANLKVAGFSLRPSSVNEIICASDRRINDLFSHGQEKSTCHMHKAALICEVASATCGERAGKLQAAMLLWSCNHASRNPKLRNALHKISRANTLKKLYPFPGIVVISSS